MRCTSQTLYTLTVHSTVCGPVTEDSGAVSDQATPAEPVGTCEHHRVVQNPKAYCALVVLQHFCRLLILTQLLH